MAKMAYREQLLHPNWQRKRLEALEHYGFKCNSCSEADKTLHVHHKHYVKGRMAWEYELAELEALCERCHKDAHGTKERLDRVVAQFPSVTWVLLADLLVGYGEDYVSTAEWEFVNSECGQAGRLAWAIAGNLSGDAEVLEVATSSCS